MYCYSVIRFVVDPFEIASDGGEIFLISHTKCRDIFGLTLLFTATSYNIWDCYVEDVGTVVP